MADHECDQFYDKRNAHTAAEQKRRNGIKKGIQQLQELIPGCNNEETEKFPMNKQTKAQVLQKGIDYLHSLQKEKEEIQLENIELEKKVMTLQVARRSYEKMVNEKDISDQPEIPPEIKFQLFQAVMDVLWESFNVNVLATNFVTTIIPWLEQFCKPDLIKSIVNRTLRSLFT